MITATRLNYYYKTETTILDSVLQDLILDKITTLYKRILPILVHKVFKVVCLTDLSGHDSQNVKSIKCCISQDGLIRYYVGKEFQIYIKRTKC